MERDFTPTSYNLRKVYFLPVPSLPHLNYDTENLVSVSVGQGVLSSHYETRKTTKTHFSLFDSE